jgi:hypothetical protein
MGPSELTCTLFLEAFFALTWILRERESWRILR